MRYFTLLLSVIALLTAVNISAQGTNVELVAHVTFDEETNDVWGYTAPDGTEYAVVGTRAATRIYSLADAANPLDVAVVPGAPSVWRDMKARGEYIYVVADQGRDGLLVIDMTGAPNTITHSFWTPQFPVLESDSIRMQILETCHNIYVDGDYAYLAGCNDSRGVLRFDLEASPTEPPFAGTLSTDYSHDVYVQDGKMYSSEIFDGELGIYDISNLTTTDTTGEVVGSIFQASQQTSTRFTHNAWASDDGNFVFTTDERGNAAVDAYDISNLSDIKSLGEFRPIGSEGSGAIPHNTHYKNGFLYTSWYTEGLVITDVNKPDNMVQVGQYDTWPGAPGGFNGSWGAYPFFDSDIVLISDIQTGLYVVRPNIQRAAYLEGVVEDAETLTPIAGATITIVEAPVTDAESDPNGNFKGGLATAGTYKVVVSHPMYFDEEYDIEFKNGVVSNLTARLTEKRLFGFTGSVMNADGAATSTPAFVYLQGEDLSYSIAVDASGNFDELVQEGSYTVTAGAWGYLYDTQENVNFEDSRSADIRLNPGYQDDFILDYGWALQDTARTGNWERGVPIATFFGTLTSNADMDIDGDIGDQCYVTGNMGGSAGFDDVDNGNPSLVSPNMDLTIYEEPVLDYSVWFFNGGGEGERNDSLTVSITNGTDTLLLQVFLDKDEEGSFWRHQEEISLADISITSTMRLIVTTGDESGTGHLVEGGFDGFKVKEGRPSPTNDLDLDDTALTIYPNPFSDRITVSRKSSNAENELWAFRLFDITGKLVQQSTFRFQSDSKEFDIVDLTAGSYLLHLVSTESGKSYSYPLSKVN